MKKDMPLEGLRWSRDSGSALCDTSQNSRSRTGCGGGKLMYAYHFLKHRRMCLKYGMYIGLNAVGKGFFIVHPGFVRIDSWVHIGENCTVLPMVLFGRAHPIDGTEIFVGDNCYIGTGATILGPIRIGNNVTIAAGAVVTKDVPDNVVVAGVPSKIVKYKSCRL